MKGLDTPVLLDVLRGAEYTRGLLRELQGEELATTEVNLFELSCLARSGTAAVQHARLAALFKLRRRLTVLPVTPDSVRVAVKRSDPRSKGVVAEGLMLGTVEAYGCEEWITTRAFLPRGSWKVRIRKVG